MLITRPEPGGRETAARVAALGYRPIAAPLLEIRALRAGLPAAEKLHAVVVTSGNAIPSLPAEYHRLPLFAVGAATTARARTAGFIQAYSADGDAQALAALVARSCDRRAGSLLLATGRGRGGTLAADLRSRGFRVVRRVVYAAMPAASLPVGARQAFNSGCLAAALFFSAETARQCVRLIRTEGLQEAVRRVDALAIGKPAAVALQALPWRCIRIAARPNQDAMLALLR